MQAEAGQLTRRRFQILRRKVLSGLRGSKIMYG
jgi:hypothetical protein